MCEFGACTDPFGPSEKYPELDDEGRMNVLVPEREEILRLESSCTHLR